TGRVVVPAAKAVAAPAVAWAAWGPAWAWAPGSATGQGAAGKTTPSARPEHSPPLLQQRGDQHPRARRIVGIGLPEMRSQETFLLAQLGPERSQHDQHGYHPAPLANHQRVA